MSKYNIPTADFFIFDEYKDARKFIGKQKYPLVIKADGQCAGKGVAVCRNEKQADDFLRKIMIEKIFGSSGKKVVIEKCLTGLEISFMVATDGKNFISFLPSQDHKPVFNGDRGLNTGGMGAYTPVPFVDKNLIKRIEKEIVTPTISAMAKEGCSYKGILYPGLILTDDGPKVLEYNCRFGDPETQPLMFNLKSDIIDIFEAIAKNKVDKLKISWHRGFSICVVLTSKGYPNDYEKGKEISGLDKLKRLKNIYIFHAGTKTDDKKLITYGGRVLGITARGRTLKSAIKLAYRYIGKGGIYFSGMHYRKDIGEKGFLK